MKLRIDATDGAVCIRFPEEVTSTHLDDSVRDFEAFKASFPAQETAPKRVVLSFEDTELIDSTGLNFIRMVLGWAKGLSLPCTAHVYERFVHMIIASVWLDREMEVVVHYEDAL